MINVKPNYNVPSIKNGFILLDKPSGISSNAALQQLKRLLKVKKMGHTGSLDPLASGMLPVCIGEATKFSQYLLNADKEYIVTAQLGSKTTTGDAEGEIIETKPIPPLTTNDILAVLEQFKGSIQQIPSMYSALKHNGQPLYKLARAGIEVERKPRTVQIYKLEFVEYKDEKLSLVIHCSKGTYVRTLVEDIGAVLGCGAYVTILRRSQVAAFESQEMLTYEQIQQLLEANSHDKFILPIEQMLQHFSAISLSKSGEFYFSRGQTVNITDKDISGFVRVYRSDDQFMGLGEIIEPGMVSPKRLILKQ
jgi:tRNA pseudouridine55 synthase